MAIDLSCPETLDLIQFAARRLTGQRRRAYQAKVVAEYLGGQARRAAGRVNAPVAALVAKPQVCNAWRNIDPALRTLADVTIVAVPGASHCDFEWPSDRLCRLACLAGMNQREQAHAHSRIRGIAVGFVRSLADAAPTALAGWKASIGSLVD